MCGAIERGLSLSDFENLTFGMILGYCTAYNNRHLSDEEKEDEIRIADQVDFDRF